MKLRELQDSVKNAFERAVDYSSNIAYQPGRALKKFPTHAKLIDVDYISFQQRFLARSHPHISVTFDGHPPQDVPVELLPSLMLESSYENKARIPAKGLRKYTLTVKSARSIAASEDGKRYVELTSRQNEKFIIRHTEIARVLFFHNSHLTRTAFRPDGLNGLAQISDTDDCTVITMSEMSDYPISNLNSGKACLHLSWLLLDDDARRSYGSIFKTAQKTPGNTTGRFEIKIPRLNGWKIEGKGIAEREHDASLLELTEVTGFHNPNFYLMKPVEIVHPRHRDTKSVEQGSERSAQSKRPDPDPELDLSMRPSKKRGVDRVNDDGLTCTFANTAPVTVRANSVETKANPSKGESLEPEVEYSSAGHGDASGSAKELDAGINRSGDGGAIELEGVEPNERFPLFEKVINQLTSTERFSLTAIKCVEMPEPDSGSQIIYRTKNGKALQCYVAVIACEEEDFAIIEVDIENLRAERTISTLILGFREDQEPNLGVLEILKSSANKGVRWDMLEIKRHAGQVATSWHPRRKRKEGNNYVDLTPIQYQERWHQLLRDKLKAIAPEKSEEL